MSDLTALIKATAVDLIQRHNALVEQISANTSDKGRLVHEIREERETTDENILKFRAFLEEIDRKREEAVAQIDAYIAANLMPKADGNFDEEATRKALAEIREEIRAAKVLLKGDEADLPEQKNLRGTGGGGSGTGGRRPRVDSIQVRVAGTDEWTDVYKDQEDKNKPGTTRRVTNFTLAAQAVAKFAGRGTKVEVSDLQAAAFSAAGTDDLSTLSGKPFSFVFTAGEKNVEVMVTPRSAE